MKTFLLALSTQASSSEAVDHAIELAKTKNARLIALFVLDSAVPETVFEKLTDMGFIGDKPGTDLRNALAGEYEQQAAQELDRLLEKANKQGVACETILRTGAFSDTVIDVIGTYAVDMLILTRTRRSALARLFLGSNIDDLLRKVPCEIKIFEEA